MDFVVELCKSAHGFTVMNESNFINNLFDTYGGTNEDSFGFITSNMLLVGAKLFSLDPSLFNPFENKNYMNMLRQYIGAPMDRSSLIDVGINALNLLFTRKDLCLAKYLLEKNENHPILFSFVKLVKTTD